MVMRWKDDERTVLAVRIQADDTLRKLAQEALDIQNASNFVAVATKLSETVKTLARHPQSAGSDWVAQNPITKLFVAKMEHLAGLEQPGNNGWWPCMELAEGKDVEFELKPDPQDITSYQRMVA